MDAATPRVSPWSRWIVAGLFALVLLHRFWPGWGPDFDNGRMIAWDTYGYYLYLPALILHGDPGLEQRAWLDRLQAEYKPTATFYQAIPGHRGRQVLKYPMGMALLWLPFFLVAHAAARPLGFAADGLSPPYSSAILAGGLLYAFAGLWLLRAVLLRHFGDRVTAWVLVLVTLGTNYWAQTASDAVMPHSTLFALNALILWLTLRWHDTRQRLFAILIGLALGLATIARPTEVLWALVPLLWARKELRHEWRSVVACAAAFAAMIAPQLVYWRYASGSWVTYTYVERFALASPFLSEVLFSYKKGWLVYTPLVVFALAGFLFIWRGKRELFWPLFVLVVVDVWVVASWESWWYGPSLGQRALMELLPALALPLGALIAFLDERATAPIRWPLAILMACTVALNLFQNWQYNHGLLDGERMTQAYYWRTFGRTSVTAADRALLEVDHWPADERLPEGLASREVYAPDLAGGVRLDPSRPFSPAWKRTYRELTSGDFVWVRAEAWISVDAEALSGPPPLIVFSYEARGRSLKYKPIPLDTKDLRPGERRRVAADFITPHPLYRDDQVTAYVWHRGPAPVTVESFRLEVFEPAKR